MELLQPNYGKLRQVMFHFTFVGDGYYGRFQETVMEFVHATNIAPHEQSNIVNKKWEKSFEEHPLQTCIIE
jgi:hypothetical protein